MVPIENGDERQLDDASIAAAMRPHASDWLWRPWYAKLWWAGIPAYWLGVGLSLKFEPLAAFFDTAFAGYCNVLFFPMTAFVVLGVGFARAWIDAFPPGDVGAGGGDDLIWPESRFDRRHSALDMFNPHSGVLYIGSPLNPLNVIHKSAGS